MKTLFFTILTLVAVILGASSCSERISTHDGVALARNAIAAGDYTLAAGTLDAAVAELSDSTASATCVGEMAVLYMVLNEQVTDEVYSAKALELYKRAMAINADSVNSLFSTMEPEDVRYLFMLRNLSTALDNPADLSEYGAYDSEDLQDEPAGGSDSVPQ